MKFRNVLTWGGLRCLQKLLENKCHKEKNKTTKKPRYSEFPQAFIAVSGSNYNGLWTLLKLVVLKIGSP